MSAEHREMDAWLTTPILSSLSWCIQHRHLAVSYPSSKFLRHKFLLLPCVQLTIPNIANHSNVYHGTYYNTPV